MRSSCQQPAPPCSELCTRRAALYCVLRIAMYESLQTAEHGTRCTLHVAVAFAVRAARHGCQSGQMRYHPVSLLLVHAALSTQSHTLLLPLVITAHRRAPARTPVALASRQLRSRRAAPCWQQRRLHHTCARERTLKVNLKLLCRGERAPRPARLRVHLTRCCEAAARGRHRSSALSAQRANFSPS